MTITDTPAASVLEQVSTRAPVTNKDAQRQASSQHLTAAENIKAEHLSANKQQTRSWFAQLELKLDYRAGTRLLGAKRTGPLSIQKAFYPEGRDCAHLYLLHPPAGIVSGDELNISVHLEKQAHTLLTTPGANRFYRARDSVDIGKTEQLQSLSCSLHEQAILENLPQETIIYPRADAFNYIDVNMTETSVYAGWDIMCLGLQASQQDFSEGQLTQRTRVHCDGKLLYHDKVSINQHNQLLQHLAGLSGNPVFGTFIVCAPSRMDALQRQELVDVVRQSIDQQQLQRNVSISDLDDLIVARYLGESSEVCKQIFTKIWQLVRPFYCAKPAAQPRIWYT